MCREIVGELLGVTVEGVAVGSTVGLVDGTVVGITDGVDVGVTVEA